MTQHEILRSAGDFDQSLLFNKRYERGCDMEVVFNEQRIPLHSVVLGGNSRYFEINLFSTPIVPKTITLENTYIETTKAIIDYCYSGKMKFYQNDAIKNLEVAHFLMIQPVIDGCSKIIISTLNSKNSFEIWKLSQKLQLISLEKSAFDFIRTAFKGITKDFLTLNLTQLIQILQSGVFDCDREKYIIFIKEWINYDPEVRKENLVNLLKNVKLEQLPVKLLISESKNICLDKSCFHLFMDAIDNRVKFNDSELNVKESTLIVLGGWTSDECKTIETYDAHSNNWRQQEVIFGRECFSSVLYDKKIFVFGGYASGIKNEMDCYDIKTLQKTSLAPMHQARFVFAAVVVGEYIYAIGGHNTPSYSSVERYNVKTNQWTQLASMATGRWNHKVTAIDGKIFAVGGYDKSQLAEVEYYTISTGKWKSCKPMQEKRDGPAVAAWHGFVYAAGGNNGSKELSSVERYDPQVDQWAFIDPLTSPHYGATLTIFCGGFTISGGKTNNKIINKVENYNPLTKQWSPMPSLNNARHFHTMLVVPQHL